MGLATRWATRWRVAAVLAVAAWSVSSATAARAERPPDDPWDAGSNWMNVRVGFAQTDVAGAGDRGLGYGVGFRHLLSPSRVNEWEVLGLKPLGFLHWTLFRRWSIGGFAEFNVISRYGDAKEIEVPAAVELTRYIGKGKGSAKPYIGFGGGPFYRKTSGTGQDFSNVKFAGFLNGGIDAPVAKHQMLGFDVRMARAANENDPPNPVFGAGQSEASHWSYKLTYSIVY